MSMSLVAKKPPIGPGSPLMSSDVMLTSDQWPRRLRSPGHHSSSQNIPRGHNEIVTDPALSRLRWWGIFWNFKMTQSVMWCGHREHNHLSPIGPSDIRRSRVCGHNECLQWSLSCSFIQILQTTDSHSIMQQSQYNTEYSHITNNLYTQFLTMTVLLACPPVCHIRPALCSIHLSWPGLCLSPITLLTSLITLRAQPSRVTLVPGGTRE